MDCIHRMQPKIWFALFEHSFSQIKLSGQFCLQQLHYCHGLSSSRVSDFSRLPTTSHLEKSRFERPKTKCWQSSAKVVYSSEAILTNHYEIRQAHQVANSNYGRRKASKMLALKVVTMLFTTRAFWKVSSQCSRQSIPTHCPGGDHAEGHQQTGQGWGREFFWLDLCKKGHQGQGLR